MQKNWHKWLAMAEFDINSKVYIETKISLFLANYERKLWMEADIRRKRKIETITKFNEKGARGSKSNIEEDTGRDEATSR